MYLGWGTEGEEVLDRVVALTEEDQYYDVAVVRVQK